MLVLEPEFGVRDSASHEILEGLRLNVQRREDADRGGYDSYVFASSRSLLLWQGIGEEHLKMFNGGYGGEVVSQHDVTFEVEPVVHARCGLGLRTPVVMELTYGKGIVIVSRLQLRNRIAHREEPEGLYSRRLDPVLQKFLQNLILYTSKRSLRETVKTAANVHH